MKKFNLLQIVPAMSSGGVEQGTLDLANFIAENKNKNFIVSNGGNMLKYLNQEYVSHYKLPVHSKNFFKMPFVAGKLNLIIKENNINILHLRSRAPAWLMPYINKKNLITVSTFHNIYGHENILKKIYNKALAKTDYIIAISKYVGEEITKEYQINPNKIKVINRGIDTDFYDATLNDKSNLIDFYRKNNISKFKKIIMYPGRLTEWKGQLDFLNIIEKLNNKSYVFYFVGDDKNSSYTKKLLSKIKKKKLQKNCKILGHLDKDNLKKMYYCSDLVVSMPLKPEGFGRVISESLAMKKIVIAHNSGGVKNQLQNLDDIYKIDSRDENKLVKKIEFILNSHATTFDQIKEHSRNHVIKNFSKKQMLEDYFNFYQDILN